MTNDACAGRKESTLYSVMESQDRLLCKISAVGAGVEEILKKLDMPIPQEQPKNIEAVTGFSVFDGMSEKVNDMYVCLDAIQGQLQRICTVIGG